MIENSFWKSFPIFRNFIQFILLFVSLIASYKELQKIISINSKVFLIFSSQIHQNYFDVVNLYWMGSMNRIALFSIKSFLYVTKKKWKINFWIHPNTTFQKYTLEQLKLLSVEIKKFIFDNEIINTPFQVYKGSRTWMNKTKYKNWNRYKIESDWVRLVLLYKYGGFYFDTDILFLQPPENLIIDFSEFVGPWCGSHTISNNNLLYLSKKNIIEMSETAVKEDSAASYFGLSFLNYNNLLKKKVKILTPCEADICWCCRVCHFNFIFFNRTEEINFLINFINTNSLLYHWHNGYGSSIHPNSYFAQLEKKFDEKLHIPSKFFF